MDEEFQKCAVEDQLETGEEQLNDNSNDIANLLTEGEFANSAGVDESSISNQGFLDAVELSAGSAGSAGDYLDNNADNTDFDVSNFDIGDNATTFPNESTDLSDSESKTVEKLNTEIMEESENEILHNNCMTTEDESIVIEELDDTSKAEVMETMTEDSVSQSDIQNIVHSEIEVENQEIIAESEPDSNITEAKIAPADNNMGGAEETEVVSEDELPAIEKPKIKDAENVSDDELPGPKPAELPADTEVVSEDELPASKKEKENKETRKRKNEDDKDDYNPDSPTSESEASSKKQAVVKNGESKPVPVEKRHSTEEKTKKKILPELDKYWKVVNDDPTDFTGWTYLLQYVDQESDVDAAREAYDAFLSHYPYCYGYWRKYADYEKRKGSKKKCHEVLERGLKAIPLSVDLWVHYLNHIKTTRAEDHAYIRAQYERAIDSCGLEFRSDRLWESYIKWEAENGSALNVTNIYDRLLTTPTLGYTSHFDNFQEHVMSEPVAGVVGGEELVRLRAEVRSTIGAQPQLDLPPGEDEPDDHIASEEEAQAIKERIIAARRKIHKNTGEQVAARWSYEERIKRPYFHVKPLERCQLKNWKAYLEWEKQHGSFKRAYVLHERCLIACALYEEFWLRLVKFLEERCEADPSLVAVLRSVLERACTVHHPDKPELHLHWAHFEEAQGNAARAADILERVEKACPNIVQIQYRRVNLERRRGDHERVSALYAQYVAGARSAAVGSALAIKHARYLHHARGDAAAARAVLDAAVARDPLNPRLHLQRLHLALHTPGTPYAELEELVSSYERQEGAELETCAAFAWRRRDLAEELGDAVAARDAAAHQRTLARHLRKRARKDKHDQPPPAPASTDANAKKKEVGGGANAATPPAAAAPYPSSVSASAPTAHGYDQTYSQPYPNNWGYPPQPPGPYPHHPHPHPHPHPWPQYTNYY